MGYIARLECGRHKLDLNSGAYALLDFTPPALSESVSLAAGTSANRYSGAQLAARRAETGNLSLGLRVLGSSNAHIEAAIERVGVFLRKGSTRQPVYLVWRPSASVSFEPSSGQWNASRRCPVVHGSIRKTGQYYGIADLRSQAVLAEIDLTINPVEGRPHYAALTTGGVFEDWIGTPDGESRGVIVSQGTSNKFTNPVFGNATWNTNWSAGADITMQYNLDPEYILFGGVSARLVRDSAGGAYSVYESINVGNTNTWTVSFFVKKRDSSAVTSSDIQPRYGGTTSGSGTYMAVGNGWYRVWKNFTGIASSQVCGLTVVNANADYFVDGFQIEEKSYPTTFSYGDQPGCVWSGTAHASATTRNICIFQMPPEWQSGGHYNDTGFEPAQYSLWLAFRTNFNASEYSVLANQKGYLLYTSLGPRLALHSSGACSFTDGTNTVTGATATVNPGTIIVLHATLSSAGISLYRNGSLDASSASVTPAGGLSTIYLGGDGATPGEYSEVTLLGAGVYERALSATEVAADYANMSAQARGGDGYGQRVDWLPWLWTNIFSGGQEVSQYSDSTHYDHFIVGGVPGTLPAKTYLDGYINSDLDTAGVGGLLLSRLDCEYAQGYQTVKYTQDLSGTVVAGSVGGQVEQISVSTTASAYTELPMVQEHLLTLAGQELALLARLSDAGDNLMLRAAYALAASGGAASEWKAITDPGANYVMRLSDFVSFDPHVESGDPAVTFAAGAGFWLEAKRSSGAAANLNIDFCRIVTRPALLIRGSGSAGISSFHYYSDPLEVLGYVGGGSYQSDTLIATGDVIEMLPGRHNFVQASSGNAISGTASVAITESFFPIKLRLTPRWALA